MPYQPSLLTNEKVIKKMKAGEDMTQYLETKDYPDGVIELVAKCLKNDPHQRPSFHKIQGYSFSAHFSRFKQRVGSH